MLLGKILALLSSFIRRPHQSLAAIGVAAFVRLMNNAGSLFTEDKWDQVRTKYQAMVVHEVTRYHWFHLRKGRNQV